MKRLNQMDKTELYNYCRDLELENIGLRKIIKTINNLSIMQNIISVRNRK